MNLTRSLTVAVLLADIQTLILETLNQSPARS